MFDLYDLYECPPNPEYRLQSQKIGVYYDKIAQTFSPEFFDEFWQAHMSMTERERDNSYREGFQEGVLLMTRALLSMPDFHGPGAAPVGAPASSA